MSPRRDHRLHRRTQGRAKTDELEHKRRRHSGASGARFAALTLTAHRSLVTLQRFLQTTDPFGSARAIERLASTALGFRWISGDLRIRRATLTTFRVLLEALAAAAALPAPTSFARSERRNAPAVDWSVSPATCSGRPLPRRGWSSARTGRWCSA
jgi:hypothetical protein